MNYRFYNARILTMEADRPLFTGEVHTEGPRIVYVGEGKIEAAERSWSRQIDCQGNLLLPGFKNAHTHSGMTLLRSRADDLPLGQWLEQQVFPVEAKLTEADIYHLTQLALLEYLTSGITAVFEMYLTPETIAAACADMGMRCVQVGAVTDSGQSPAQLAKLYRKLNRRDALNSFILGFHGEYTCSEETLKQVVALVHQYKAPVFSHLAETEAETEGCRERHNGMTPAVYLDSLGMYDYGGGGYHCVHMKEADLAVFQKRGLYAVTNPASNLKLASGIAPVADFLKKGIAVAIGTDGPASNNCLDMFREMFLVTGLAKVREHDAAAVDAMEVLRMACVNGAKCMGLTETVSLCPGNLADMIMIDLHQPNMQPLNNIAKNIVYSGSKQNIKMTMIDGKILYYAGDFYLGNNITSAASIYAKANEIAARFQV